MSDSIIPVETWRDIPGYEAVYQVSDWGRVRNLKTNYHLNPSTTDRGYLSVMLTINNKQRFRVHRLVMLAFVGECPEGHEVNHKNGNKADNRLENLEYMTHSANVLHTYHSLKREPTRVFGESHGLSKLTENEVSQIRQALSNGKSQRKIASEYGVCQTTISLINRGVIWTIQTKGESDV